ncbi:GNAT family N-acetyltransferase [Gillisia marina]|uniref:GNAT family N-acetyltransferase n=1 Tax=Gillisia marina TaxID=1167637 RepID=UPI000299EDCE|nr:GNAT family N-acetyltransferase [Gillisia marina]
MEFLIGKLEDTEEIVTVLKKSLGAGKLPKSAEIWKYKHFLNPFGESLIIVAKEEGKIIGVRALMRFDWRLNHSKEFKTFRAVDTGVLPDYQGVGVFNKMNKMAVDNASERGFFFIFNTPNEKSLPGNLKLGWKKVDNINVSFKPLIPQFKRKPHFNLPKAKDLSIVSNLTNESNKINSRRNRIFIPKSPEYLLWRYIQNPLQDYQCYFSEDYFIAFYEKKHSNFNELRISECIFFERNARREIEEIIISFAKSKGANIITFSPRLDIFKFKFSLKLGPILVIKTLIEKMEGLNPKNLNQWNYHLGDLELF